jgi:hypothetical protein
VPVTFNKFLVYLDRVWDTMQAIGTHPFSQLDTIMNKAIFLEGMLIHIDKPDEDLPSKRLYSEEELRDFNNMASILPYPLAICLQSIGNASDGKQIVTPVLAEFLGNECSGAITFAPRQLLPLLKILRTGVPDAQDVHNVAQALNGIPGFAWEQFDGPAISGLS